MDPKGKSILVNKKCANETECTPHSIGCYHIDNQKSVIKDFCPFGGLRQLFPHPLQTTPTGKLAAVDDDNDDDKKMWVQTREDTL
ncbi:hypothetical protein RUM44_000123 [Polyplax serrata]|uniref:Uncharacterized protein n=1 Tax=Polyplax serrata TaxID=468196 RepID=A0ABR1B4L2_POLSC